MSALRQPNPHLKPTALAVLALVATLAAGAAQAQQAPAPQRIEITGSSIKRLDGETALPVQTLRREDIEKLGVTTASELLQKISANVGGLTDGASISDQAGAQRGFNGANLRGLGVSSTLVLLNGRRLANFASPGDNAGVDLNNIPAGAIQRVEVLKDGASAIYGTDAMGGVINFITRRDYQGADLSLYALATGEGGASKTTFTVSGGYGDLARDRFNVLVSLDLQRLGALRSSERDFIREYDLARRLPAQLSSNSFPANVDLTAGQLSALNAFVLANPNTALRGSNPDGTWNPGGPVSNSRRVNFANASCTGGDNPNSRNAAGPGGREGCSYNYMGDTEIYPESQRSSVVARGTFQLADDHQLFAEALFSRSQTDYAASPATSGRIRTSSNILLPAALRAVTGINSAVDFRFRLTDAGNRTNRVDSDATRFVLGATGRLGEWDYDTAINLAKNEATDTNLSGWVSFSRLIAGMQSGAYNPFQVGTSGAGRDFMQSIRLDGGARFSEGTSRGIDAKFSRALTRMAGGEAVLALGAEVRREATEFRASDALKSNDITGDRASSGALLADTSHKRSVSGLYAEAVLPFAKQWEAQLALRHDRYGGVFDARTGQTSSDLSTTNPKIGLSFRPSGQLLARASFGTGFRAPSISELFRPVRAGVTASFVRDPVSGEVAQMPIDRYSACDPAFPGGSTGCDLKPEKSRQFSLGVVFEPSREWNLSVDYWAIRKSDIISEIGEETIFTNPVYYNNPAIVRRFNDGFVDVVIVRKENRGKLNTAGLDLSASWRGGSTAWGRFGAGINGTLVTEYKFNTDPRSPLVDGLAKFRDDKAVQRWRHRLNVDWDFGKLGLSLGNTYFSGYRDQNVAGLSAPEWSDRDVKAYSLWDLAGSYSFSKNLTLRAGVLNLLDTAPPFTNQSRYFQVTWDPTYGDPRGRSFYANLKYSFR